MHLLGQLRQLEQLRNAVDTYCTGRWSQANLTTQSGEKPSKCNQCDSCIRCHIFFSSFWALIGNRYLFTHRALVLIFPRIIQLVNIIVNVLLGIRYLFTHRAFILILLGVIQLVNMIVNALLVIRYFFQPSFPCPNSSESHTVSQYDCQHSIRY